MKLNLISIAVMAALGASTGAQALDFAFDPTGGGNLVNTSSTTIDWSPGNGLALDGVTAFNNALIGEGSTNFTLYYQANLNSVQNADGLNLFSNGQSGSFFTATMGFNEQVLSATVVGNEAKASFGLAPGDSYFNMYATSALASNLTGTGFVNDPAILTGHLVSVGSSNFDIPNVTTSQTLDGSPNGDQWSGQQTLVGSGSTQLTIMIDSANASYFPDLPIGTQIVLTMFNNSQVAPYNAVDPSRCFNTDALTCAADSTGGINPTIGAINGANGPDFIFQADANQTLTTVPEPGSIALLGLGLGLLGLRGMRRRAA